ncbi:MAG: nucleoside deaminase [Parachlamydiaceae bacterium]|nr:nucleoside deaminase [Parachlamydiaceae bacterium]
MHFPFSIQPNNDDERFMLEALKEAWKAFQKAEVPIGAVLVQDDRIIARGHNQVEMLRDATAHAEMLCITAGEGAIDNWRLADTVLYCTIEPCSMCAGAMLLSRVPVLVWGAPDLRHGANGSWIDLFDKPHPMHTITIRRGVLEEYSATLMRNFFQKRREEKRVIENGE